MTYLNLHTHHPVHEDERTIPSFGLHPWFLTEDWSAQIPSITASITATESFIGECGLDRLCDTPYDRQMAAFEAQIALSEQLGIPLILHCVKAIDDVIRLKRTTHQPWIWHGFRGKPQQLQQLLDHNFYISFGFKYHPDSLQACPSDRLFLETDDIPDAIAPLYHKAALLRGLDTEILCEQVWQNYLSIKKMAFPA